MKKQNLSIFMLRTSVIVAIVFLLYGCVALSKSIIAENANKKGAAAYETGDYPLAEIYFESAVNVNPRYASAWLNLARVAAKRRNYDLAISSYNNVLDHSANPDNIRLARLGLANIYNDTSIEEPLRKKGWYKKAIAQLEALVDQYPDNPQYRLQLGFAFFNAANPGSGMEQLSVASRLANTPETRWVHNKLLDFYLKINLKGNAKKERNILDSAELLTQSNN